MDVLSITLVFFALVIALLISYLAYFYKAAKADGKFLLFALRALSIFCLLLLLINPKFNKTSVEIVKSNLFVAVDNSSSIVYTKNDSVATDLLNSLSNHKELNDRFNTRFFTFGSELKNGNDPRFDDAKTNIYQSLNKLNELANGEKSPIVMITDGNQTIGSDYRYYQSDQFIYPVLLGDTIKHDDLEISQINVNSYSFLNNNFPVEVFINYSGDKNIGSKFTIHNEGKVVYTENLNFSSDSKSAHLQIQLEADNIGKQFYEVKVSSFNDEKNVINNSGNFSVDIVDEQTKIAVVYDVVHPDLGLFKKSIETNKQRKVELLNVDEVVDFNEDYGAYILFQPTQKFDQIIRYIKNKNLNYFLVCGKSVDWNYINKNLSVFSKKETNKAGAYGAAYNKNFNVYMAEDLNFMDLPFLEGYSGNVEISVQHDVLLNQFIDGIETEYPLMGTFKDNGQKGAFIFGENLWKWRSSIFVKDNSYDKFDNFLGSVVQYLTITRTSDEIELEFNDIYYSDENITIKAAVYDTNFNFDKSSELFFQLDDSGERIPFFSGNNYFQVNLGELESGNYNFTVTNTRNNALKKGSFTIVDYSIEQQLTTSNKGDMEALAKNSNGEIIYPSQLDKLTRALLSNASFKSIQKEKSNTISLIEWKWILGIIVLSLSLEWFIRKYRGLI